MTRNTVARRADAFAHWTRLDQLAFLGREGEPHNLRWWPALALIAMPLGYAMLIAGTDHHVGSFALAVVGGVLFFGAFIASSYLRTLGPRLNTNLSRDLDERERMLRARAGRISGRIIAALAIAGCFYCGSARQLGWWSPTRMLEWIYLGLVIEGWMLMLPTLVVSWLQPRGDPD